MTLRELTEITSGYEFMFVFSVPDEETKKPLFCFNFKENTPDLAIFGYSRYSAEAITPSVWMNFEVVRISISDNNINVLVKLTPPGASD